MRPLVVLALVAACSSGGRSRAADPWDVVVLPGAKARLYLYPDPIVRYAPEDRGGYVVRPRAGTTAGALIAALAPADPDDIVEDGVVLRLSDAERAKVAARGEVGAVEILQPSLRRGMLWDHDAATAEIRVDLFADADDAERDAVAAWLETRGAVVLWRGKAALRAKAPQDAIRDLARLGPVRWVE